MKPTIKTGQAVWFYVVTLTNDASRKRGYRVESRRVDGIYTGRYTDHGKLIPPTITMRLRNGRTRQVSEGLLRNARRQRLLGPIPGTSIR
jgi:hypothetical protein